MKSLAQSGAFFVWIELHGETRVPTLHHAIACTFTAPNPRFMATSCMAGLGVFGWSIRMDGLESNRIGIQL